jgi:hypothetical protein
MIKQRQKKMKNIPPPRPHPPSPHSTSPDVNLKSYNSSPSMFDHIKQGFGFGLGNAISHKMMDSVFNNQKSEKSDINYQVKEIKNTKEMYELYNKCLEENKQDIDCNNILKSNI